MSATRSGLMRGLVDDINFADDPVDVTLQFVTNAMPRCGGPEGSERCHVGRSDKAR